MNILYLTTVLPNKRRTGGELATQTFIDALRKHHDVQVIGYTRANDNYVLQPYELSVDERPIETQEAGYYQQLWLVRALMSGLPYSVAKYHSRRYAELVQQQLSRPKYHVIILEHSQLGWLLPYLKNQAVIFNTQNVEYALYAEQSKEAPGLRQWLLKREARLMKVLELNLSNQAQQIWTLTRSDADHFATLAESKKTRVFGIPSAIEPSNTLPSKKMDVGLMGTWTWQANLEGLTWFLQKVCPLLPTTLSIHVAGKGTDTLTAPPNVAFKGFVPDAKVFLQEARVVAVPSTQGGGIQIKTLDAIAVGSSLVVTPIALRGIDNPPAAIHVADTPEAFAKSILAALESARGVEPSLVQWSQQRRHTFQEMLLQTLVNSPEEHALRKIR
jgi:polysaccharide biosynthesis protein PslH